MEGLLITMCFDFDIKCGVCCSLCEVCMLSCLYDGISKSRT